MLIAQAYGKSGTYGPTTAFVVGLCHLTAEQGQSPQKGTQMRHSFATAAILAFIATGALAQTQNPPAKDGPQNSAINSPDSSNRQADAPVAGRNSFTEGEAKSRIERGSKRRPASHRAPSRIGPIGPTPSGSMTIGKSARSKHT